MSWGRIAWLYLWIAPHVLLAPIAAVMFRKKLHRDFPIFFTYLVFEFAQFCLLATWHLRPPPVSTYLRADMLLRAGSVALRFGILRDIFEAPVLHNAPVRRTMTPVLHVITAVLVLLALLFIGTIYYSYRGYWALQTYFTIEALNTAQCGLVVLAFLWHRFLGIRMSRFVFGIAFGLGLITGSEPLMHALRDSLEARFFHVVDFTQMGIYHIAVLVWLCYVLAWDNIPGD